MTKYFGKIIMAMFISTMVMTGCATTRGHLNAENYIQEEIPHPQTYFARVQANEGDGDFTITGKLRIKGHPGPAIPARVQVTLLDAEGMVLESQKVPYYPAIMGGSRHSREARFIARFSETPPPGTVIRLSNVNY